MTTVFHGMAVFIFSMGSFLILGIIFIFSSVFIMLEKIYMTTDGSCREAVYFWHVILDDTGIMFQQCFHSSLMLEKIHMTTVITVE